MTQARKLHKRLIGMITMTSMMPYHLLFLTSCVIVYDAIKVIVRLFLQRPNAKELLKHKFIRNAKKNSCLQDLIERYRRWKASGGDSGDDLSDNEVM